MQAADGLEVNIAGHDGEPMLAGQGGDPGVIAGNRRSRGLQFAPKFRISPRGFDADSQQVEQGQIGGTGESSFSTNGDRF